MADNALSMKEIVMEYEMVTGEITGHDSIARCIRRMRRARLIRLASTGRDLPGLAEGMYFAITPAGSKVLKAFKEIME